jgi:hypothetical protein
VRVKLLLLLTLFSLSVSAQNLTNSAYSRYGIGDLQFTGFTTNRAMGGISQGYNNPYVMNYSNPASYAGIKITAIQIGASSSSYVQQTSVARQKGNNTNFAYFILGFPIKKWWGTSLGLLPYSAVGYKINTSGNSTNIAGSTLNYLFKGNGGLNRLYWGNGFKPFKGFSIGANSCFLFGDVTRERRAFYTDGLSFNTREQAESNIKGFDFNFGSQYQYDFKNDWSLTAGVTYGMGTTLNASSTTIIQSYTESSSGITIKDTIAYTSSIKGTVVLPSQMGGGITIRKSDQLLFGLDYTNEKWTDFRLFGKSDSLANSNKIAIGFQYTPDASLKANNFKRTQYRAGFRYGNTFLKINNTQLTDMAITFGFGLPLPAVPRLATNFFSTANISVELGKRGTFNNNLIEEKYFKVGFGLVINNKWFDQRKID